MRSKSILIAALFLCPFVLASCGGSGGTSGSGLGDDAGIITAPNQSNDHLDIINDDEELKGFVHLLDIPVEIEGPSGKPSYAHDFSLTLIATIDSPSIDDDVLQATCVVEKGDKAIVCFNMAGAPRLGGIQLIKTGPNHDIKLESQATFSDADVSAIDEEGSYIYAALALDIDAEGNGDFDYPAVLEKIKLQGNKLVIDENARVGLESYVATGVRAQPGNKPVYVTTGGSGGVFAVKKDMTVIDSYELAHARWVDLDGDYLVVAQGGDENGVLSLFDWDDDEFSLEADYDFDGANISGSKTTVEIAGDVALVAAGPEGVKIISLIDGTELGSVDCPDVDIPEEDNVANAVAVKDKLLFISFGGAGVYVVKSEEKFKDIEDEDDVDLEVLGYLDLGEHVSVNHVEYKSNHLYVASGLGGLSIIKVEHAN